MIKYSTPNDLIRQLQQEEGTEKKRLAKPLPAMEDNLPDITESMALLSEMLDKLFAEPREECVRKVLEYSRSLNLR